MSDAIPMQLETVTRVTPLGLSFRDATTKERVADGLSVVAYPEKQPQRRVVALPNPSGVFVVSGLPGLRDWENGAGDDEFWKQALPDVKFTVEVNDPQGRFLPVLLKGLTARRWRQQVGAPTGADPVDLYPAPARPVPAGRAAVRAQLFDPKAGAFAAWAVLDVTYRGGAIATGLADEMGRVVVVLAYPPTPPDGPLDGQPPYTALQWPLKFAARYPLASATQSPDRDSVLSQPLAKLWADETQVAPFGEQSLRYGSELVLRSGGTPAVPSPYLLITPA